MLMLAAKDRVIRFEGKWSPGQKIWQIASLVVLLVIVLFGLFAYTKYRSLKAETEDQLNYFARSLEQATSNLLDSSNSDLNALALNLGSLGGQGSYLEANNITPMLAAWSGNRPWVRSVSVISRTGEVVFSSIPSDVGKPVDLSLLGQLPSPGQNTQQGPVLMGRGIAELHAVNPNNPDGSPLLTLIRAKALPYDATVYLVVLLNLDYFSNYFDLLMERSGNQVAMLNYSGVIMAGTENIGATPGRVDAQTPIFTEFLPKRESGKYKGFAILGSETVDRVTAFISFRALRNWPVVIVVQHPTTEFMAEFKEGLVPAFVAFIGILMLIFGFSKAGLRSYRRDSQLRSELDMQAQQTNAAVVRDLAIQESSIDAIIIIDEDDKTLSLNPAAESIFGYQAAELLGRPMAEILMPSELRHMHYLILKNAIKPGDSSLHRSRRETWGQRADGSWFPMEVGVVPIKTTTGCNFIVTIRDITLLKNEQNKTTDLLNELDLNAKELASKNLILEHATQRELEIAQRIQSSMLVSPPTHVDPRVWISAFNQASKGVDGDFFEVLTVGKNSFDLVAGDVMGKGISAALVGAATKLQFSRSIVSLLVEHEHRETIPQPHEIISHVSQSITPHLQSLNSFVTLIYIRIDLANDTLIWVGCGHEESLLRMCNGKTAMLSNQHPPLGVLLNKPFEQSELPFNAGDFLFLSSDGASDALDREGRQIGRDLVNDTVQRLLGIHPTPSMTLHTMRRKLLTEDVTLKDDLTLVLLTRPLHENLCRLEVPLSFDSLRPLRSFIEDLSARVGLEEVRAGQFVVAAAEILTNAIRHSTGLLGDAPIEIIGITEVSQLVVEFKYLGDYFEPPNVLDEIDFHEYPEGGFGLQIIRDATDRVDYLHEDGVNTISIWIYR
jgi:PAS domain S-box-containing protein